MRAFPLAFVIDDWWVYQPASGARMKRLADGYWGHHSITVH